MKAAFNPFTELNNLFTSFEQATAYLDNACVQMGVRHLSYWCVSYSQGVPDQVSWIATYPPEYMNHYMSNYTPIGDPAFEATMTGSIVTDWSDLTADASVQTIHDTASKYGIAKHGLSFPIREQQHHDVLFSVNVDCTDAEWAALRVPLASSIHMLAHYFHRRVTPLIRARNDSQDNLAA